MKAAGLRHTQSQANYEKGSVCETTLPCELHPARPLIGGALPNWFCQSDDAGNPCSRCDDVAPTSLNEGRGEVVVLAPQLCCGAMACIPLLVR